jgi:hypothetical protein
MSSRRPKTKTLNGRSLVLAIDGPEKEIRVYKFTKRDFVERPRHNPFANLG